MQATNISFGQNATVDLLWSSFKSIALLKRAPVMFAEKDGVYTVFFCEDGIVYKTTLYKSSVSEAARYPEGYDFTQNDIDCVDFEENYRDALNRSSVKRSAAGVPESESSPRTGNKVQIISQNFCDKNTWYSTSVRRTNRAMSDSGDGLTFQLAADVCGVDCTHGRILHERRIRDQHKPVVKVNGVVKKEKDPHDNTGDYTIDYTTMRVTFLVSQSGTEVTIDFSEVVDSKWYLRPTAGKKLRIMSAELQFSTDARMQDTFMFQPRGDVSKFTALAPYWDSNGGPYPAGTMIPLGAPTCYQTVFDLICEANLAYPVIPKIQSNPPTWRDTLSDILIFSWDYGQQAVIDVSDGPGLDANDIEISLEHDLEMAGACAVITFYCISEDA